MFSKLFVHNEPVAPDTVINLVHPGAKPEEYKPAYEAGYIRHDDPVIRDNKIIPRVPPRPGDTEPRQFVGKTLDTLNKTLTSYSTERDLLAKDIAKLNNEYAQLETSLDAIKAAIDKLSQQAAPVEAAVAQALEAEFPTNDGTK